MQFGPITEKNTGERTWYHTNYEDLFISKNYFMQFRDSLITLFQMRSGHNACMEFVSNFGNVVHEF